MQNKDDDFWEKLAYIEVTDEEVDRMLKKHEFQDRILLSHFVYIKPEEKIEIEPQKTQIKQEDHKEKRIREEEEEENRKKQKLEEKKKESEEKEAKKKEMEEMERKKEEDIKRELERRMEEKPLKVEEKEEIKKENPKTEEKIKNEKGDSTTIPTRDIKTAPTLYDQDWKLEPNKICQDLENQDVEIEEEVETYGALKENLEIFMKYSNLNSEFIQRFQKLHLDTIRTIYRRYQKETEPVNISNYKEEKKKPLIVKTSISKNEIIKTENPTSFCTNAIQKIFKSSPKTEDKELASAISGKPSEYSATSTIPGTNYSAKGTGQSKKKAREQAVSSLFINIAKDGRFPSDIIEQSLKLFPSLKEYLR